MKIWSEGDWGKMNSCQGNGHEKKDRKQLFSVSIKDRKEFQGQMSCHPASNPHEFSRKILARSLSES